MPARIRPLIKADLPVCSQIMADSSLWQRYGITRESAFRRFSRGFEQNAEIWVADNREVQGFVWYIHKGVFQRSGAIFLIGVHPAVQGQGIGTQLMDSAEEQLFDKASDIQLFVADFDLSAQRFFSNRGYAQVSGLPGYIMAGTTELIYRKVKP
jgi:ribosomal protein S18 acetylase RimI-like enzyme